MSLFWKYLKPYSGYIILTLVLAGIAQVLSLYDPIIFGRIIDEYALNPADRNNDENINGVLKLLAIAVGIALAARLFLSFKDYFLRMVVQKFGMQIFNDGLRQTLRLPFQEFEDQSSGEILSILQKVRTDTERFFNSFINILFSSIVGVGFLLWYAVTKHWALIPVFLVGVVVLGGLTSILSRSIKTLQRSLIRQNRQMSGTITESLRNIELVKSLGLTYPEIRRLKVHTQEIYDLEMAKVKKMRTLTFLQGGILIMLKQSILFILLWLIFRNVLSPGELISMQFISTGIIGPLQDLGNIILSYREAETALALFNELMQKQPEYSPEEPVDIGPIEQLHFDNVVFRHKNASYNAIQNISFKAGLGDTIAFVGPSGSGKSTLVKLLVGLYRPVEGDILYDNISIKELRYNRVRRQMGFVTQDTQLFSGTIRENLLFVKPDATEEEMTESLQKASAMAIINNSGHGLDTILGEGGKKLSSGEKQRLSIARALLRKPRLLIFDEATSALDSLTEQQITETVKEISQDRQQITLLIAHRLSTIMHADTIYVLEPAPPFEVTGAPGAPAVVCGDTTLDHARLDALTGGLAAALVRAGTVPGDAVGVCVGRGVWSVAAMLAVWRAGGVYVPLDPRLPEERLRYMCEEAAVRHLVCDARTRDRATALATGTVDVDGVLADPAGPRHAPRPDDLAYVIFTSGSTGRPKAVGVEHHALDAHVAAARETFGLTAGDRVLTFASTSFDASLEQILPALSTGATVLVRPDQIWTPEELAAYVAAERVTVMELTPSYWTELVARLDTLAPRLATLRLLVTGGEALPADPLAHWFAHLPGVPVVNTYGPTETVISATAHTVAGAPAGRVPIGRPLGSRRAYVTDPLGEPVPAGVPGELVLGGPETARGYLGRPALTAERFVPDPFGTPGGRLYRTGDVVRRLPDGQLEFLGRNDDQVKIRGFRVEPGEAEAVLRAHPGVSGAAVVVRTLGGETSLVGYAAGGGLSEESLRTHCRARLPHYLVPAAFVLLDALPLTVQGKLDTAALPEPEASAPHSGVAPRTPAETVVAQIWCEVLDLPKVGVHDDFFALGGHSLRAVAVASRLRTAFDCPLQVRDLFEHPTVERLAAEVERRLLELISQMSDDEIDLSLTADL